MRQVAGLEEDWVGGAVAGVVGNPDGGEDNEDVVGRSVVIVGAKVSLLLSSCNARRIIP